MSFVFILLLIFGALAAFFMLVGGISKLTGQPAMREAAEHFSIAWDRYRLIGILEIAGAIGVVVGLWVHGLGLAAGIGIAALMAGALVFQVRMRDAANAMAPALLALAAGGGYAVVQAVELWG